MLELLVSAVLFIVLELAALAVVIGIFVAIVCLICTILSIFDKGEKI